jgi:hypothetical protein
VLAGQFEDVGGGTVGLAGGGAVAGAAELERGGPAWDGFGHKIALAIKSATWTLPMLYRLRRREGSEAQCGRARLLARDSEQRTPPKTKIQDFISAPEKTCDCVDIDDFLGAPEATMLLFSPIMRALVGCSVESFLP